MGDISANKQPLSIEKYHKISKSSSLTGTLSSQVEEIRESIERKALYLNSDNFDNPQFDVLALRGI